MSTVSGVENNVSLTQVRQLLMRNYKAERSGDSSVRMIPLLLGPPGCGKSSCVKQFSMELNALEGDWALMHVRLNQKDPTDLKGVPIYQEIDGNKYADWATPFDFPIVGQPKSADGKKVLIFIDELPQATPVMQNLAANIIDGIIGDALLDIDRTFIVLAGNRKEDNAATMPIPMNVRTRVITYNVRIDVKEWLDYGTVTGVNPLVLGFIHNNPNSFNEKITNTAQTVANPRTWEILSNDINFIGTEQWVKDPLSRNQCMGSVGVGVGSVFFDYATNYMDGITISKIISKESLPLPKESSRLFSLVYAAAAHINGIIDKITEVNYQVGEEEVSRQVLSFITKRDVDEINTLYNWFSNPDIDISIGYLLNKFQAPRTKKKFRYIMQLCSMFSDSYRYYEELNKKYTQYINGIGK